MNTHVPVDDPEVLRRVRRVFVDVVRYPDEFFEGIDDDLENDLGIDSVKLGEVLVGLRAEFRLDEDDIGAERMPPAKLRTLRQVAAAVLELSGGRDRGAVIATPAPVLAIEPVTAPPLPREPADIASGSLPEAEVLAIVVKTFADVTRYPDDLLRPDDDLEDDLGIDSVKLGEVFEALRRRLSVPEPGDWPADASRTMRSIAAAIAARGVPTAPVATRAAVAAAPLPVAAALSVAAPQRDRRFEGKVAFVTGSGRGLGRTYVLKLAELGAEVVVNSFHSRDAGEAVAAEVVALGGKAHHVWGSVGNPVHIDRMYREIEARCGGLDYLINNASNGVIAPFEEVTADAMLKAYSTQVVAAHLGSLAAARLMQRRGGGRIVNLSATAARGHMKLYSCMAPVKAALEVLTVYLAQELMPYNVQVMCLAPGAVYGDMIDSWPGSEGFLRRWEALSPGGRVCVPEDLAEVVAFLLSSETRHLNGSVIPMDGGCASAVAGAY